MSAPDTAETTLHTAVRNKVRLGSTVYTDNKPSVRQYGNGLAHTNDIESTRAVLKRGHNGGHNKGYHNRSVKYYQKYVYKFLFRPNNGNYKRDTQNEPDSLFKRSGGNAIIYKGLMT